MNNIMFTNLTNLNGQMYIIKKLTKEMWKKALIQVRINFPKKKGPEWDGFNSESIE